MLSSLGEKNAAASRKWKSLSSDEKDRYNEAAAVMNSEDKAVDIKKEVKKLRDLLSLLVSYCVKSCSHRNKFERKFLLDKIVLLSHKAHLQSKLF